MSTNGCQIFGKSVVNAVGLSGAKEKLIHPGLVTETGIIVTYGFLCLKTRRSVPLNRNLVDSRFDHDSCGVGFVATLRNVPSHEILTQALTALARLAHRGAIAADEKAATVWAL